ncbi:uncharacterized protein LTR77_000373 [Saxophila tyrrhenica]|uniref:Uncharacterized protein n=1 Tax=Saxophila tyrrhenica TaxID=1690608 RepID=A0AAV9PND4_9PEZI|nr:hypothetical protein LTR77_000373 [Saxophila tyrrhenica]
MTSSGGGLWHPDSQPTQLMRRDIDRHSRRLKDVLLEDRLRKEFLGGVAKQDAKAVKALVSANAENALKTRPKGYDADHPDIDLLRLRNYTIGRKLNDSEVVGPHGLDRIAELLSCMKPFITYLNSVVMPDEPASASDDEDEEEDENQNDGESSDEEGSE